MEPHQKRTLQNGSIKSAIAPTSQPLLPAKIDPEIFKQISTALYQNRFLQVHYRSIHGKEHKAKVKPLALVQQGPSSYVVAEYEHGDILTFSLASIYLK